MGAWGCGLYDNDIALDCIDDYEDYLKDSMDKQTAIKELVESWYITDNYSILVIADLLIQNFGKVEDNIKPIIKKAIEEEKANISEWRNPKERKKVLDDFYNKVKPYITE